MNEIRPPPALDDAVLLVDGDTVPASKSGWRPVLKGPPGRLRASARSARIFTDPMGPNPWLMKFEA